MMMINKRIINTLLILDIGLILFCYFIGSHIWLINSQIGFISASLIVFASMYSYGKMVHRQVENAKPLDDTDDVLEKIEDLYDNSSHSEFMSESKILNQVQDDNCIQEEASKEELKRSMWSSLKSSRAYISLYRIVAYGVLALGFLYLSSNNIFHIVSYFTGISLPIIIIIILLYLQAKRGDI
jgi:hypothetical protein